MKPSPTDHVVQNQIRKFVTHDALGRVQLALSDPDLSTGKRHAYFECVSDGMPMYFVPEDGWYVCPDCSQELTLIEAEALIRQSCQLFESLRTEISTRGRAPWPRRLLAFLRRRDP